MGEWLGHGGALLRRDKRVVTVVCGVVHAGCVFCHRLTRTSASNIHIGDRRKGLNETKKTITFN